MSVFDTSLSPFLREYFLANPQVLMDLETTNAQLFALSGIVDFFSKVSELEELHQSLKKNPSELLQVDRRAYGDFQTNRTLASKVIEHVQHQESSPEWLIEPTCGKGNFILAALNQFTTLKEITGIEIYLPYVWECKLAILEAHLRKQTSCKPRIRIEHKDIFGYDFSKLAQASKDHKILIAGNPPWITNAELGSLDAHNLPSKSNFKGLKGIDAITGKGNFDIAEYISLQLLRHFDRHEGAIAWLVKQAVVKNLLLGQQERPYRLGKLQQLRIDAKKEFQAAVSACLFYAALNKEPAITCEEIDFYSQTPITEFGWYGQKFVYRLSQYRQVAEIDGQSSLVWRQGVKHDCAKVMELMRHEDHYINGLKIEVDPEKDLLYGLLKSSDLKAEIVHSYRKTTIITQKKVGQDTSYLQEAYPKTFAYLQAHRAHFDKRKSSIYRGKPPFSIFGIGEYSFAPYKVAISGMYKRTTFSLVLPENGKALMLDDTCYFIGFDQLEMAQIALRILNSPLVQFFLQSIIFPDAKRPITKEVLMRIDLCKAMDLLLSEDSFAEFRQNPQWNTFRKKIQ